MTYNVIKRLLCIMSSTLMTYNVINKLLNVYINKLFNMHEYIFIYIPLFNQMYIIYMFIHNFTNNIIVTSNNIIDDCMFIEKLYCLVHNVLKRLANFVIQCQYVNGVRRHFMTIDVTFSALLIILLLLIFFIFYFIYLLFFIYLFFYL